MSDVFSNLAAQSLGSSVAVQPLVPPLFAPASQRLSDAVLWASNDQPAVAAGQAVFSIKPSSIVDGMTDRSEMEQPSEEVITPEKRTILPDLVPSDVPQNAISILSLRHLLHFPHLSRDRMVPVSHLSDSSTHAPTVDEPLSEDSLPISFPQNSSIRADLSHVYQLSPIEAQETAPHETIPNSQEILPSSMHLDDQKHTAENPFRVAPTNHEPQHSSPEDHPARPTGNAFHLQYVSPSSDKHLEPLAIRPALPVSLPSSQPDVQSEYIVNSNEIPVEDRFIGPSVDVPTPNPAQQTTIGRQEPGSPSLPHDRTDPLVVEPLLDRSARSIRRNEGGEERQGGTLLPSAVFPHPADTLQSVESRFISATAAVPVQSVISPMAPYANHVLPDATDDDQRRDPGAASRGGINSFKPTDEVSAINSSTASETPHMPQVTPIYQAALVPDEAEQPPIRVTIGRVVVRAIPAAQPAPMQKRVLRPAQSLDEYLKQRERGSR